MGGIALGKAVVSSGLLETMDVAIRHLVNGLPLYEVVLALSAVVMVRPAHSLLGRCIPLLCLAHR
jgi:phosphate transporter